MKTVIVGDIGGQINVFKDVVTSVGGNPDTCVLPADVTMIQVGDVVRFHEYPYLDSLACALYAQKLLDSNDGRYIQLLGNHETPLLGGTRTPYWKVADLPESRPIVQRWWDDRLARIGVVLRKQGERDTLVTHSGLTRGFMQRHGATNAVDAVRVLNSHVGNASITELENPGGLVYGLKDLSSDTFWALLGPEVHDSWVGHHPDFNQVHGHATLVAWATGRYFQDVSEVTRKSTAVNLQDRYSVTTYESGYSIRSVDWVLQNGYRRMEWPLLVLDGWEVIQ